MKILYIHQYFRTPDEGGSTRSYELAKGLVKLGHQVRMITAHNTLNGKYPIEGIEVHYLKVPYHNRFGFLRRIFAFLRFVRLAKKTLKKLDGGDVAYVMTTPLTTGLIALYLREKKRIPYIFEVGDLWPEAPVQMGVINNRWLRKELYAFEKRCYLKAKKIVALSPAIAEYIQSVVPQKEVHIVPNLADCEFFQPSKQNNQILQIGYFGAFGKANGLDQLLFLASYLQQKSIPIHFTLMGEGSEAEFLSNGSNDLKNVSLVPFGNKNSVKEWMARMDAIYISYKNIPVLNTGSPNKLFDGLAAGKLIAINFDGWIKELIESNACGFSHDPQQPESFVEQITPFLMDRQLLEKWQKNSRQLAEKQFEKKQLIRALDKIIIRST